MPRGDHRLPAALLFLLFFFSSGAFHAHADSSSPSVKFTPADNYLLDCGGARSTTLDDGRTFRSDPQSSSFLSTSEDILVTATNASSASNVSALVISARVFSEESTYSFFIANPGRHWVRLHFYPFPHPTYNLTGAVFTVTTDTFVLLRDFSVPTAAAGPVLKEYLLPIDGDRASLIFTPKKNSVAFVNAIELVSAPDTLVPDTATSVSPQGDFAGLSAYALEVSYRLNMGGDAVTPKGDTLGRAWQPDDGFLTLPGATRNVSVPTRDVKFPDGGGVTPLIAPSVVYSTAEAMADANVTDPNFNITWQLNVEPAFSYLVRMHFCDIISHQLNQLYFNVYLNGLIGVSGLDLSTLTSGLAVAYYKDFVLNASAVANSTIRVQLGPATGSNDGTPNAILNGLEVMKMSNVADSLDGLFSIDGSYRGEPDSGSVARKVVSAIGLSMGALAMGLLLLMVYRWRRRPDDWEKRNSFSSWLLPIHASHSTFCSSSTKGGSNRRQRFGSHKSKSGYSSFFASGALGLGRYFTFAELQEATGNFDDKAVIGVGGFGKVYLGELEDGTKLAVKRGNPSSEQGINEFQTEIQMLSKLRHRHLVSLIGYCDENSEMILVYEYMSNGPLRDHLYGNSAGTAHPLLSWKQRLEVCIGAARGLHYLHTGAAQGIIHRDVKTTNILLDEQLVAKVADFGLSKAAPSMEQTHVSTAVKGSFGYLDPEYFRRQQLTEKSDVYSFGVVLFEVLCARPAINPALPREQVNLAEWAMQWHRKNQLEKILDPHLAGTISPTSLTKYVEAAEKCLADCGVDRPSMGDVLWNLEYALQLQEAAMGQADDPTLQNSSKHIALEYSLSSIDEAGGEAGGGAVAVNEDSGAIVTPHTVQGR
ncbi:hypothetical protein Taro_023679 [Colocasia esculenta]|uniref:Protein kinase domain-containing protein n=1 Tax=Colocasia esculenta TaxID=4460 RepID=A0A843V932_COLES|nr:hypothetical protein [Colocasia esculenta]